MQWSSFTHSVCTQVDELPHNNLLSNICKVFERTAMYSERPLTADHESTDSPDTESLLSIDQSQEKPLLSLQSVSSKRNKKLKSYLHIAAIVFYSTISVVLYAWGAKINGQKCECDQALVYCKKAQNYSNGESVALTRFISSRENGHKIRETNNCS